MARIYVPAKSAEEWSGLLADRKHWKEGNSAKRLAVCRQGADAFPPEVAGLFADSGRPEMAEVELLLAIPEHQIPLPPVRGHASQNDLFALARSKGAGMISITVEGKVSESFDKTVAEWKPDSTEGKAERLKYLREKLHLEQAELDTIRYQLLHRLASAIIEAGRFSAKNAMMIIHSFSASDEGFGDYEAFCRLYNAEARVGKLVHLFDERDLSVFCGWVRG